MRTRPSRIYLTAIIALAAFLSITIPSFAQTPKWIGTNGEWSAYTYKEGKSLVCYMASVPIRAEGKYKSRGDIYALVTNNPAKKSKGAINVVTGYTYKKDSEASVKIGGQKFSLFTSEDRAWTKNASADAKMVKAMRRGNKMVVKGKSSRGTLTTDTYSLKGFTKTLNLINKTCKM